MSVNIVHANEVSQNVVYHPKNLEAEIYDDDEKDFEVFEAEYSASKYVEIYEQSAKTQTINDRAQALDEESACDDMDQESDETVDTDYSDKDYDHNTAAKDFLREFISKKVPSQFVAKFGRQPTEEEMEIFVADALNKADQIFGFSSKLNFAVFTQQTDEDYDPYNIIEQAQALRDEIEDCATTTDEELSVDFDDEIDCESEEDTFDDNLWVSAIQNVEKLAKFHQKAFVDHICDTFNEVTGREPTDEQICEIFNGIKTDFADEAQEDYEQVEDDEDEESDSDYSPQTDEYDYTQDINDDICESSSSDEYDDEEKEELLEEEASTLDEESDKLLDESVKSEKSDEDYDELDEEDQAQKLKDEQEDIASSSSSTDHESETDDILEVKQQEPEVDDADAVVDAEEEEELELLDEEEFDEEWNAALENVKNLGHKHQEELVENVCDAFIEETGREPTGQELSNTFGRIRKTLAAEARDEFVYGDEEDVDTEEEEEEDEEKEESEYDEEADEDYSPEKDEYDYSQDVEDDVAESSENDEVEVHID